MSKAITEEHLGWYDDPELPQKVTEAATNPMVKAFISLLATTGVRPTQAIHLTVPDFDFKKEALRVMCLKEPYRTDCPDCGQRMAKKHHFCPTCGSKVPQPVRERIDEQHYRIIPVHPRTLALIDEYLKCSQFSYQRPRLFGFSRQRAWEVTERVGRRAGLQGLHPETLRHLLAARWVNRGLDVDNLRFLLGYSLSSTGRPLRFSFEEVQAEYRKLWET